MFSMTAKGETLAELKKNLLASAAAIQAGKADDEAPAPKKKAAPKDEDDEPAPKPKKKAAAPADDGDLDYENDVRPVVVAFSKDFGRDEALEILGEFTNEATDEPCTKGQEVSESDWPKLLSKLKKARAAHADD